MRDTLIYEGIWWFAADPNQKFLGTLTFDQFKGGTLSLTGEPQRHNGVKLILGKTTEGQKVTLDECSFSNQFTDLSDIEKTVFRVKRIFLGEHFQKSEDIKFEKVIVEYSNLDKRINKGSLQGSFRYSNGKENFIKYSNTEGIRTRVNDNTILQIAAKPQISYPTHEHREASIKEKIGIIFELSSDNNTKEYNTLIHIVPDFLNLVIPYDVVTLSIVGIIRAQIDPNNKV